MKKVIMFGTIIATISSNNATAMLLRYIKPTPQRIIQKRHHINAQLRKNIFNIDVNSEPRVELNGKFNDLYDRNQAIEQLLTQQSENSRLLIKKLDQQKDIAISLSHFFNHNGYTFYDEPLNIKELRKTENELKNLLAKNLSISTSIQNQASCLESKPIGQCGQIIL